MQDNKILIIKFNLIDYLTLNLAKEGSCLHEI
jgi:hypothetical protein